MRLKHLLTTTVSTMALALLVGFASSARASVDYTDVWWTTGGTEGGWGVNFQHTNISNIPSTNDFVFATFFVYGPDGQPFWYAADMRRTTGETFSGPMYRVNGTFFGTLPFVRGATTQVGTATFTATNSYTGTLSYNVNTTMVNKNIQRQDAPAFTVADPSAADGSGLYLGGLSGTTTGAACQNGGGTFRQPSQYRVIQQASPAALRIEFYDFAQTPNLLCAMQGNIVQHGKTITMTGGTYQCGTTLMTSVNMEGVRLLDNAIEGHWSANIGNATNVCTEAGRLAGVKQ